MGLHQRRVERDGAADGGLGGLQPVEVCQCIAQVEKSGGIRGVRGDRLTQRRDRFGRPAKGAERGAAQEQRRSVARLLFQYDVRSGQCVGGLSLGQQCPAQTEMCGEVPRAQRRGVIEVGDRRRGLAGAELQQAVEVDSARIIGSVGKYGAVQRLGFGVVSGLLIANRSQEHRGNVQHPHSIVCKW